MRNPVNFGENSPNFFCIQKVLSQQMTLFVLQENANVSERQMSIGTNI